jgi:hypothetical protein
LVGIRIQLVDAFGDLLAEAITPESGQTVLVCACDPQQALFVRVPALGVHVRVTSPQLQIRMPEVSWQP